MKRSAGTGTNCTFACHGCATEPMTTTARPGCSASRPQPSAVISALGLSRCFGSSEDFAAQPKDCANDRQRLDVDRLCYLHDELCGGVDRNLMRFCDVRKGDVALDGRVVASTCELIAHCDILRAEVRPPLAVDDPVDVGLAWHPRPVARDVIADGSAPRRWDELAVQQPGSRRRVARDDITLTVERDLQTRAR